MRYRAELSKEAEAQRSKLPRKVRDWLERAIDELKSETIHSEQYEGASGPPSGRGDFESGSERIGSF
jgi:mRNA-degrading endonuclease RelE of RelBE toxin-antitoxin system